jgi:hypothetical protein
MKTFVVSSMVVLVVLLAGAPPAIAATTECTGVLTGTHDNVVVPSGQDCEMLGATVTGNVLVRQDASLRASASQIAGNVLGLDSSWVCLQFGSELGGNFHVRGGDPMTTTGFDIGVEVQGNALVTENAGLTFIDAAQVGGKIEVRKNTGTLEIEHNTVGGHVRIDENDVPPTYTGGPATPGPGGCGVPTSFILGVGGMSAFNNQLPDSNMFVLKNDGPGSKQVVANSVDHLRCMGNSPPFVGGPNVAEDAEGQCF